MNNLTFYLLFLFLLLSNNIFGYSSYKIRDLGTLETEYSIATSINDNCFISGFYLDKSNPKEWKYPVFIWSPIVELKVMSFNEAIFAHTNGPGNHPLLTNNGELFGIMGSQYFGQLYNYNTSSLSINRLSTNKWIKYPEKIKIYSVNDLGELVFGEDGKILISGRDIDLTDMLNDRNRILINNKSEIFGLLKNDGIHQYSLFYLNLNDNNIIEKSVNANLSIFDINNHGIAVGIISSKSTGKTKGFIWEPQKEFLIFLDNFLPKLINDKGLLVGEIVNPDQTRSLGILNNGKTTNLIEAIGLDWNTVDGWQKIIGITDMNNHGQMVGIGERINGKKHAILIYPIEF